jgi:polysaccharide export outer membrane protein
MVDYHIQNGDNLYVKLTSTEPLTNQVLSPEMGMVFNQGLESRYRDVYLVDNKGDIKLPELGKIHVGNYTIAQIKDSIERNIQRYFSQVIVDVRLADNYITIIGNVNRPGRYLFDFRDKITIFELIGMAGDLTYEANRKEVKLIRKNGEETSITTLDLTNIVILSGSHYYIFPNDILYIEPLKAITWDQRSFPFTSTLALILSVTTSVLVIISYLR